MGHRRVISLMRKMGIQAVYRKPNISKRHPGQAITKYGKAEIVNTDQVCQFTSLEFTEMLKEHGIQISMDGKGCWCDNVVTERFWRRVKYEEVYLRAYETTSEARKHLHDYIAFYNIGRGHQALEYKTPSGVYFVNQVAALAA